MSHQPISGRFIHLLKGVRYGPLWIIEVKRTRLTYSDTSYPLES